MTSRNPSPLAAKVLLFVLSSAFSSLSLASDFPYGHKPYVEASSSTLTVAGIYRKSGRKEKLQKEARDAFERMRQAADAEGVRIIVVSGFRSKARQKPLWERAIRRYHSREKAAFWVAPPGYSEHHTGLALDVGDEKRPKTDVEMSFEGTEAFAWLKRRAGEFGFELSFGKGSPSVHYEPWHWRFVGSPAAQAVFSNEREGQFQ